MSGLVCNIKTYSDYKIFRICLFPILLDFDIGSNLSPYGNLQNNAVHSNLTVMFKCKNIARTNPKIMMVFYNMYILSRLIGLAVYD